ncbi:MAG: ATP-binding cassette domain-containing protein [Alphaproteobacteria bacterium]|nr:ATP-binding cassette domain-containing protein [Alphaproteobacteria bacterium]
MTECLPLDLEGVAFARGSRIILEPTTLRFEQGRRTIILGPNGAGKSVLLRLCHGLLRPDRGHVRWRGPAAAVAPPRQAMVFQRPILLRRSVLANVTYGLALHGVPRRQRPRRARAALERVGLAAFAGRPARVLSVGEQQRTALARAWALEPEILFLDEPTASLDPAATRLIEAAIVDIHRAGTTIVMTTHDLGQARRLADIIIFLHRGRVIEQAAVDDFFTAPRSAEAAAFLGGNLL